MSKTWVAISTMTTYPAIEPVTYRWRQRGAELWIYDPTPEWVKDHAHEVEIEPVYSCDQVGNLRSQLVKTGEILKAAREYISTEADEGFRPALRMIELIDAALLTDDQQKPAPKGPAGDAGQVGWMGGEFDR